MILGKTQVWHKATFLFLRWSSINSCYHEFDPKNLRWCKSLVREWNAALSNPWWGGFKVYLHLGGGGSWWASQCQCMQVHNVKSTQVKAYLKNQHTAFHLSDNGTGTGTPYGVQLLLAQWLRSLGERTWHAYLGTRAQSWGGAHLEYRYAQIEGAWLFCIPFFAHTVIKYELSFVLGCFWSLY